MHIARRIGVGVVGAAVLGGIVWWQLQPNAAAPPSRDRDAALAAAGETSTLLIGSESPTGAASWLALASLDPAAGRGSIIYIPAHTAVEVPGRGLQPLGAALESGDPTLLVVSAESLLGIDIDHYAEVTASGSRALFDQIGPLTVEVPEEVRLAAGNDSARLLFSPGSQELGPGELVNLLYEVGLDGDDVELGARHLAFWDALLDEFHATPSALGGSVAAVGRETGPSDAEPSEAADLLESLAGLGGEDLTLTILPVRQVGVGGSELYETDAEEVATFMDETLASEGAPSAVEVQILNGNGVPGIGEKVAKALVGEGFRIALSGNAPNFTHKKTQIVTYDASPAGVAAADRASRLLGVGEVLVSAQEQGIVSVDLTIVVGKDFLRIR